MKEVFFDTILLKFDSQQLVDTLLKAWLKNIDVLFVLVQLLGYVMLQSADYCMVSSFLLLIG